MNIVYWLIAAILLLLLELSNPGYFLFLSFSIGSLAGMITSFLGYSFVWQVVGAFLTTLISCGILIGWLKKQIQSTNKEHQSNIFALIGQKGFIVKKVTSQEAGQVRINGEVWMCKSMHEGALEIGDPVRIIRVIGAHVLVEKI